MKWCCVLLLCVWFRLSRQELSPVLKASGVADSDKTGCYIVVLKKDSNSSVFENVRSTLLELSKDSHLYGSVQNVAKAITITLNDSNLETVSYSKYSPGHAVSCYHNRFGLCLKWSILRKRL